MPSRARVKACMGFGFLVALKLSHSLAWDLRAQGPSPGTQAERRQRTPSRVSGIRRGLRSTWGWWPEWRTP